MLGPALKRMRPRERQLLWLAYAEGYSHREIAEITGLASASIRLLLFRARRKVARLLRENIQKTRGRNETGRVRTGKEVAELLSRGYWPEACNAELRAHVAGCRACRDLVVVRQAFRAERAFAAGEARLEPPGVLWWRAQLRRRNAAIERIGRPILGAQIFALAVSLAAAIVYLGSQARRGFDWLAWLGQIPRALHFERCCPTRCRSIRERHGWCSPWRPCWP